MLWFNPRQRLEPRQPLTHPSPSPGGMGERTKNEGRNSWIETRIANKTEKKNKVIIIVITTTIYIRIYISDAQGNCS